MKNSWIAALMGMSVAAGTTAPVLAADRTGPVITANVTGTQGTNGWYTSDVRVAWSVTDEESRVRRMSGCSATTVTSDTSGKTQTCTATSFGGTSQQSVTIKRDTGSPAVTIATPAAGATYTQNQAVNASYACSDSLSGVARCTGTTAFGAAVNTASAGSKTFSVTATDQAGNARTFSVTYTVVGSTPIATGAAQLFAWNDLGMHCMDSDYSVFTLLPPFNTLNAQLVVGGKLVSSGYTLEYGSAADPNTGSINTTSAGKTNFWEHVLALFGASPPLNHGLTGNPTASATPAPMAWNSEFSWFEATGIPITPKDDAGNTNAYPLVKVTARDGAGRVVASTDTVAPVSSEINCAACHASGAGSAAAKPAGGWVSLTPANAEKEWRFNVLRLHDEKNAGGAYSTLLSAKGYGGSLESSALSGRPVMCDNCHNSNALAVWGIKGTAGVSDMTAAMHNRHANAVDPESMLTLQDDATRNGCYNCHPGKNTQCLRGAMGNPVDRAGKHTMECQSCHGSMLTVGNRARSGWFDMPTCQSCHHDGKRESVAINADGTFKTWSDARFASNADTPVAGVSLYRFSTGHGNLQCEACHNSTHAEFTNKPSASGNQVNDNLRAIAAQGYAAAIRECTVCHSTPPGTAKGGPHGMHTIGSWWVKEHHDMVTSSNSAECLYCHGTTSAGSPLAVVKAAKTFSIGDGRTKSFAADERVTCWSCHNGPMR